MISFSTVLDIFEQSLKTDFRNGGYIRFRTDDASLLWLVWRNAVQKVSSIIIGDASSGPEIHALPGTKRFNISCCCRRSLRTSAVKKPRSFDALNGLRLSGMPERGRWPISVKSPNSLGDRLHFVKILGAFGFCSVVLSPILASKTIGVCNVKLNDLVQKMWSRKILYNSIKF